MAGHTSEEGRSARTTRAVSMLAASIASLLSTEENVVSMATMPSTAAVPSRVSVAARSIRITSIADDRKHVTAVSDRSLAGNDRRSVLLPSSEVHVLLVGHRGRLRWAAALQPVGPLRP